MGTSLLLSFSVVLDAGAHVPLCLLLGSFLQNLSSNFQCEEIQEKVFYLT